MATSKVQCETRKSCPEAATGWEKCAPYATASGSSTHARSSPGYHSTKCVSAGLFLLLGQGRFKDELGLPQVPTEISAHGIAYQIINHGMRIFCVREKSARAVAATDLPHDFTLDDLHWPLPGIVVGFPPGFMQEYMGRDICYIYAANYDAGDYHVPTLAGCPTVVVPTAKVGWQFYAWGDGKLGSFVTSFFRGDPESGRPPASSASRGREASSTSRDG